MPEYGHILGAAQDMRFADRINQLRYHEQQKKRAIAENESKAQLFANDLDYQNAMNAYDSPKIKEFAINKIKELGKYYRDNPDLMSNPEKLAQVALMKKELKSNPDLVRGLASDNAYKSYLTDLREVAKNPNMHDTEAYNEIQKQWDNYLQYGNQDGIEASTKEGSKAFVYTKPQDFVDLPQTLIKAGNGIKNFDVKKGRNIGEYWTEPNQDELRAIKDSIYQQHGRQIQVEARKMGLTSPQQVDKWVSDNIAAGFNKHYSVGDANAAFSNWMRMKEYDLHKRKADREAAQESPYTTWDDFTDPKHKAGYVNQNVARKVWGDKPPIKVFGNNGATADLSGHDFNYDGRFVDVGGVKFLLGTVNLPLNIAEEKGIYKQGWFTSDGITSDFLDKASVETGTNKDGKEEKYVKVEYALPVNSKDKTAKSMYEINSMPSKLVPMPEKDNQMPATVIQNGHEYHWNSQTGQYE